MITSTLYLSKEKEIKFSVDVTSRKERASLNKKLTSWMEQNGVEYNRSYSEYDLEKIDCHEEKTGKFTKRYTVSYNLLSLEDYRKISAYVRVLRNVEA